MSASVALQHETSPATLRRADPWLVAALLSFETLFVLFLMAGRYKADPRLQSLTESISIDITALLFGACVVGMIAVILGRKYRLSVAAPAVLASAGAFFGYAVLSLLWTPGGTYAQSKALHVGGLTAGTLAFCAVVIASRRYRVERLFAVFVAFCVWLSLESVLYQQATGSDQSVMALGGNYLGLGRMIGAAALVALSHGLFVARPGLPRTVSITLAVAFGAVLLILGGRMPLLATAAGALAPLVIAVNLHPRDTRRWARWTYGLLLVGALGGAAYLFAASEAPRTLQRLMVLSDAALDSSVQGRFEHYESAVEFWWERPVFGHGIGAWPMLLLRDEVRAYPHNLVLEVLVELGLLGLLLLAALAVCACRSLGSLKQIAADPLRMTILMLLVNALCNALVSGDLADNRFLFAILGLACLPRCRKDKP
ncbi:MAG TPA: hypothetical protein DD670_08990 [Planctomycetaceae bacterium]|nr:hypothetical protein [Planctomycetaceae bacterium]